MSPFDGDLLADDEMLQALQSKENEFLFSHLEEDEEEPGEEDIQRTVSHSLSDALSCCQKTKACTCILLDSASRLGCIVRYQPC